MTAAQAREAARQGDGRFGLQEHADDDLDSLHDETATSSLSPEELMTTAQRSARIWWSRQSGPVGHAGMDVDDVASEAVVALLQQRERGADIEYEKAFVDRIAKIAPTTGPGSVDRRARAMFRDRIAGFEQEHHRHPTRLERSDIADDIRAGWHDPRHRPSVGFEDETRQVWFEDYDRPAEASAARQAPAAGETVNHGIEGALDQLEDSDGSCQGKFTARREAWDTLATATGAPPARPRSMRVHHATAARKQIKAAGGAARVAADWDAGRDDATTEALFAPFGGSELDGTGRERVVELLTRHQAYAEELWAAAVRTSENRTRAS
ncbi:hypothetical protein [Aeromicrobium sp. CTD01-1L150]|uniref:hypothetical protein n=1 Tax=Aeromicrobium sp. CTD01-1L150 TaxID=3341830 RepID=UPI0035C25076